ncbi:MAG: hypothetical protein AABX86_02310 [Nanoarchaeota archaeon]
MGKAKTIGTTVLVVLFILLILFTVFERISRECQKDSDCPSSYYCGADFSCHPVVAGEQQIMVKESNLIPALLLGIAIVLAAWIIKRKA